MAGDERGRLIHVVGFVPWAFKYVNQQHEGVATEWKMVQVLSAFNAFVDADACCIDGMANAAFFATLPLPPRFVQEPPLSLQALQQAAFVRAGTQDVVPRLYVSFYVGDYDSAAWVYNELKDRWDDADRGQVPLGWALDAELSWRFPPAFLYALNTTTSKDRVVSGDSGAGYLNPTQLLPPRAPSGLPPANGTWAAHNAPLYAQFDVRFTGFLINGDAGAMTPAAERTYAPFSPLGVVDEFDPVQGATTRLNGRMPVFSQRDLPGGSNATEAAATILAWYNASDPGPQFFVWRSVLQYPSYYAQVSQLLASKGGGTVAVVDPHVLSALARAHLSGDNSHQVAYEPEHVQPLAPRAGSSVSLTMTVRNDGWAPLLANYSMCAAFVAGASGAGSGVSAGGGAGAGQRTCVQLGANVESGARASVRAHVRVPATSGERVLQYQLVLDDGVTGFDQFGNPPVRISMHVEE